MLKIQRLLVPSSQAVSSGSNFAISAYAIISFDHSDFLKWCIFSVSTLALQGSLRSIFLESEFSVYGTVRKKNLQICIIVSLFFVIGLVFACNSILSLQFSATDVFLSMYCFSLLLVDSLRYKYLKFKPKLTLFADLAIFLMACLLLIAHFGSIHLGVNEALSSMIGVQIGSVAFLLFFGNNSLIEVSKNQDFYSEKFLGLQSLINLICMVSANFILVRFLSVEQLREFRSIQLFVSPLQSLTLIFWLRSLYGYQENSVNRLWMEFMSRLKMGTVITTFTIAGIGFMQIYSDLSLEQLTAAFLAFAIVMTNVVCMPLNLILRKLNLYKSMAYLSAGFSLMTPLLFLIFRENLSLIQVFAVPLILQTSLFICFLRIIRVMRDSETESML